MLLACVLVLLSQEIDDFSIVEVNFSVLFVFSAILNYQFLLKRIDSIKNLRVSPNPFIHELRIRYFVFSLKSSPTDLEKQKIFDHFKVATDNFFHFKYQYIWESLIIKKYIKDLHLALVKLVKVNTCKYHSHTDTNKGFTFLNNFELQSQFYLFSIFHRIKKTLNQSDLDLNLIKYFNYLNKFEGLDFDVTQALVDFTVIITTAVTDQKIDKIIQLIGKKLRQIKKSSQSIIKKFGKETKFCKLYGTFLRDIMNQAEGDSLLQEIGIVSAEGSTVQEKSDIDLGDPLMIVSGWYENIGTIVYANDSIYSLLKATSAKQLIGTSFTTLIPAPFDKIHNNVLFRYLTYRNSTDLIRGHLFLIDENKNCIEVTMHFRITFYKSNPYFVASFKEMLPAKNLVLCSNYGEIYSVSEKVHNLFPGSALNIQSLIPNIQSYLDKYEYEEIFEYSENITCLMKKSALSIDGYQMMIIYFLDSESNTALNFVENKNTKSVNFEEAFDYNKKHAPTTKIKEFKRSKSSVKSETKDICSISSGKKISRSLNIVINVCTGLEIIIALTLLLLILQIIQSISVNNIVFDTGKMRFLSCSILSNVRSLDLKSQNYTLGYSESIYRANILSSSTQLKTLLTTYMTINIPILNNKKYYFNEATLEMFSIVNGSTIMYESTLYDSIVNVIIFSQLISNTTTKNFPLIRDKFLFLYRNIPSNYINVLNITVMNINNDLIQYTDTVFQYLNYVGLICLIPPVFICFYSVFCFFYIENTNKQFWVEISKVKTENLLIKRATMISRLYTVHDFEYLLEETKDRIRMNFEKKKII